MNREQRRKVSKGMSNEPMDVSGIVVHFKNGQYFNLDTNKVQIVDKETNRPLFQEVLEPVPKQIESTEPQQVKNEQTAESYTVEFDTPEGKMIYTKQGNWSGVKPA